MEAIAVLRTGTPDDVQRALDARAPIEQAKGILMARHRIGADAAFEMLTHQSQRTNRKLRDVALEHIASASSRD